jgi:hypothetical protein
MSRRWCQGRLVIMGLMRKPYFEQSVCSFCFGFGFWVVTINDRARNFFSFLFEDFPFS